MLCGCAGGGFANRPLAVGADNDETPPVAVRPSRPVILMAFSGGGSRATALALAVLQELRRQPSPPGGPPLIDDIAAVSSVSGGSVTAAYFGLYGPAGLDRMVPDFLERDNIGTLELAAANPVTWVRLLVGDYTRVDALREMFDRQLFHGKTFADLNRPGGPLIILNASDMASGEVFAFTPARFNDICSDLSSLPIAVGVAASAAFPVLLSPVDLRNYAGKECPGAPPPRPWIAANLQKRYTPYLDVEEYKRARYANALRRGPDAYRDIAYLHLLDGGLADNLGVHSLIDAVISPHGSLGLVPAINSGQVKQIVLISVNARSDPPNTVGQDPATPGVVSMIGSVISTPLDANTAGVAAQVRELADQLNRAGANAPRDALFGGLRVYNIEIDFDQFRADQKDLRARVKAIPTTWTLNQTQRDDAIRAGTLLLQQHPCFQRLLLDLGIAAPFVEPDVAMTGCPFAVDHSKPLAAASSPAGHRSRTPTH